jgi:hypothetical protein
MGEPADGGGPSSGFKIHQKFLEEGDVYVPLESFNKRIGHRDLVLDPLEPVFPASLICLRD